MDASSNLNLPYIAAAQAQKHVTHNEAVRALDAIVQPMVLDKDQSSPPGSPTDGARYVVAASPIGAWAGQAGKITAYQDGAWAFYAPREGWLAWVGDEDKLYVWNGSAWAEFAGGGGGLANVLEDTSPELGGDLDANGHSIGFDSGTGITDDAGNEQIVFHKTASAVNQVGVTNAATGIKGDLEIPFACTINQVTLLADQSGSIVVDIWKDSYANYPPTGADSITASAKPTISSATKSQDATLTGWTTAIAAGDTLRFNVDSATAIQRCTVALKVTKS